MKNKTSNSRPAQRQTQGPGKAKTPNRPQNNRGRPRPQGKDQRLTAPSAFGSVSGTSRPQIDSMQNNGDLRVRVRHREYIAELIGSVAYALSAQLRINPGSKICFPWLSNIANNFESYKFNKLRFAYRTESPTTGAGKALLSVDWDATDTPPSSKIVFLQSRTKADGPVWSNFDLDCDFRDLNKLPQRYVLSGALPSGTDQKLYDAGYFFAASQGASAATAIGELWVEYDVELITPVSALLNGPASAHLTGAGTVTNVNPFGTDPQIAGNLPIGFSTDSAGTFDITFPTPGQYMLDFAFGGTGITAVTPITIVPTTGGSAKAGDGFVANGSATVATQLWLVNIQTPNTYVQWQVGSTTIATSDVRIGPYQYALN